TNSSPAIQFGHNGLLWWIAVDINRKAIGSQSPCAQLKGYPRRGTRCALNPLRAAERRYSLACALQPHKEVGSLSCDHADCISRDNDYPCPFHNADGWNPWRSENMCTRLKLSEKTSD